MPLWRINKFYGGLSTGSKKGVDGSFRWGQYLDFKTDPDLLQANLAMASDSSTNVTGKIKWFAHYDKAGTKTYFAYDDGGKIYSDASSWTSIKTVSSSAGQGMAIFGDYLYFASSTVLGRYGDLSGTPTFTDSYQTLTADANWHPMKVFLNFLCIGNGRTLATLDSSLNWDASQITLPVGWKIKSLEVKGDLLYIGCWKGTNITDFEQGALFSWDGTSTTWNSVEFINESGVNALLNQNDTLYVWAGTRGNIYQYVGGKFYKIKKVPNIGNGKYAEVWPGAVTSFNGNILFGMAGLTDSTTLKQGVYSWSQAEKNYPMVLNYEYSNSLLSQTGATVAVSALYAASPIKLYQGIKDNTTYKIDALSSSTIYTSAVYETLVYDAGDVYRTKIAKYIKVYTAPFTASESVSVAYKVDRAASWTTLTNTVEPFETTSLLIFPFIDPNAGSPGFFRWREIEIQITLTNGAKLIDAVVEFDFDGIQG